MDAVASATSLFNLSFFHFFHYFIEIFFYRFFQMKKVKEFQTDGYDPATFPIRKSPSFYPF